MDFQYAGDFGLHGISFEKATYEDWGEKSNFLEVEHINSTTCSDFMKVAVPLKVYKVGKTVPWT